MMSSAISQLHGFSSMITSRRLQLRPARFIPGKVLNVMSSDGRGTDVSNLENKTTLSYVEDISKSHNGSSVKSQPISEGSVGAYNGHIQEEVLSQPKRAAKIHDFCFGIPFGGLVLSGGLLGFIFSRNTATLSTGVLFGGALLALSTFSLKVWKQGKSSLPFILGQAVLAMALLWKNFQAYSLTQKIFPTGLNAAKQTNSRVLMFPWLAHGHVFPFLELAKNLSKKNFHIYFCSTAINLNSVEKSLKNDSCDKFSIHLVELHLPSLPELPPQYHTTKNIPPHLMPTLMKAFQMSRSSFSDILSDLKPDLLIYDGFQPWSAKLASSQGIPPVIFATSGSTSLSFFHHIYTHKSCDTFPDKAIWLREHEMRDMLALSQSIKVEDTDEGFAFGMFKLSCDIVLLKSSKGIEAKYIDHLSTLCNKKIVPTGPLISPSSNHGDSNMILKWLDQKRECSTLYISFGSENYFSKEQIGEIAKGLEVSHVNFIWVLRSPSGSNHELLPDGFLERVEDRGTVVQDWAPQTAILGHPSVGGFMSHCGWSSITESIYFGVPVVALPLKLDQPVNARLVVEAGVGVEVMRDDVNGGFDGEGVAKAIKDVFVEESGEGLRRKARDMGGKMRMEEDKAIDVVAIELSRICIKK